jgi:hypothetical protein
MEAEPKPLVYIPPNAKINVKNDKLSPPKTKYDKRQVVLSREEIKDKITKRDTP